MVPSCTKRATGQYLQTFGTGREKRRQSSQLDVDDSGIAHGTDRSDGRRHDGQRCITRGPYRYICGARVLEIAQRGRRARRRNSTATRTVRKKGDFTSTRRILIFTSNRRIVVTSTIGYLRDYFIKNTKLPVTLRLIACIRRLFRHMNHKFQYDCYLLRYRPQRDSFRIELSHRSLRSPPPPPPPVVRTRRSRSRVYARRGRPSLDSRATNYSNYFRPCQLQLIGRSRDAANGAGAGEGTFPDSRPRQRRRNKEFRRRVVPATRREVLPIAERQRGGRDFLRTYL